MSALCLCQCCIMYSIDIVCPWVFWLLGWRISGCCTATAGGHEASSLCWHLALWDGEVSDLGFRTLGTRNLYTPDQPPNLAKAASRTCNIIPTSFPTGHSKDCSRSLRRCKQQAADSWVAVAFNSSTPVQHVRGCSRARTTKFEQGRISDVNTARSYHTAACRRWTASHSPSGQSRRVLGDGYSHLSFFDAVLCI